MDAISGHTTITAIAGNRQRLDGGAMFGNAPRALWERWLTPDEHGRVELACRAMLVQVAERKILCETGIGAYLDPKLASRFGVIEDQHMLLKNLSKAGVTPDEIDYVVLSHLHFDHAGGLLPSYEEIVAGGNRLVFPHAKFIVGREAFSRASTPHERDRASFIPGLVQLLEDSGRLIIIDEDGSGVPCELSSRLSFMFSHGHTPGQMHTILRGDRETVIFAGDLIPGLPWVHLPITMGYDRFPELVIDEKKELYTSAVPNNWNLFFTHDMHSALAKVRRTDNGKFEPYDVIDQPLFHQI